MPPRIYINGRKNLIKRCINNLIDNAIKYADKVNVALTKSNNNLFIKIDDNGPGIPEEIKDSIFFPMITGKDKGTGLGLSITQGIISQHNGNIHFNSEPERTEFFINIPINSKKGLDLKSANG